MNSFTLLEHSYFVLYNILISLKSAIKIAFTCINGLHLYFSMNCKWKVYFLHFHVFLCENMSARAVVLDFFIPRSSIVYNNIQSPHGFYSCS